MVSTSDCFCDDLPLISADLHVISADLQVSMNTHELTMVACSTQSVHSYNMCSALGRGTFCHILLFSNAYATCEGGFNFNT